MKLKLFEIKLRQKVEWDPQTVHKISKKSAYNQILNTRYVWWRLTLGKQVGLFERRKKLVYCLRKVTFYLTFKQISHAKY